MFHTASGEIIAIGYDGTVRISTPTYYSSSDCSGTPYVQGLSYYGKLLNIIGVKMQLDINTPPTTISMQSSFDTGNKNCVKFSNTSPLKNAYQLIPASSPFQEPVPLPLKIKYQ